MEKVFHELKCGESKAKEEVNKLLDQLDTL